MSVFIADLFDNAGQKVDMGMTLSVGLLFFRDKRLRQHVTCYTHPALLHGEGCALPNLPRSAHLGGVFRYVALACVTHRRHAWGEETRWGKASLVATDCVRDEAASDCGRARYPGAAMHEQMSVWRL